MRQTIKYFLWIVCLVLGAQAAWAFSLLGPVGTAGTTGGAVEDNWQITAIGYLPIGPPGASAPPFIGTDSHTYGPKNLGEGYRCNTPILYYTFDPDFVWFGANGEDAVDQAFDTLNGVLNGQTNTPMFIVNPNTGILMGATNGVFNGPSVSLGLTNGVDKYTTNLTEFPLNSQGLNYTAQSLELTDLKSTTLVLMMQELGLADAIRYVWGLMDRDTTGATCTPTTPASAGPGLANGVTYETIMRNFDIVPSSLTNYQYSPYINSSLYSYYIWETCAAPGFSPPIADALDVLVDPLNYNPPVASGNGEGFLLNGGFYTGLTRDDVAGLRYLLSTNNLFDTAAGFREQPAVGSTFFFTNSAPLAQQQLATTNFNALFTAALTNSPANLQALYPALTFTNITSFYSNVVSSRIVFVTNSPIGGVSGQQYIGTQTVYSTNIVIFYQYAFDNVVTNKIYNNTSYALQTIIVGPPIGQPVGTAFTTNVSVQTFQSNIVSGDYFIISNGFCGPNIIQTLQTNVNVVTNLVSGVTNTDGSSIVQNLIYYYTNYVFVVQPCTLVTNAVADYQGIGRMQFVRVSDDNYDYQNGQFYVAVTNQYSMVVITNHQYVTRTFQRVVTRPDILFSAQDLLTGGNAPVGGAEISSSEPNFIDSRAAQTLAGPGIIDPTGGTNIAIIFDDTGPIYQNTGPNTLTGPGGVANLAGVNWASFDGTTNPPVVYPNGTSIQNLAAASFVQVSPAPPALPNGTVGVGYNATLTATGGQPPYTWTLSPNSAGLPHGLTVSSNGVISGTPTQSGTFDSIIIQTTDSSYPVPIVVETVYSLTIN